MTRTVTIFGEQAIMAHKHYVAKRIRALELYYLMIQFLIKVIANTGIKS